MQYSSVSEADAVSVSVRMACASEITEALLKFILLTGSGQCFRCQYEYHTFSRDRIAFVIARTASSIFRPTDVLLLLSSSPSAPYSSGT